MTEHPDQSFNEIQTPVEQSDSIGSHKLRDTMKSVAAYSILATALGMGATLASVFWSSSNASLQSELRRNQEEIARLKDELAKTSIRNLPLEGRQIVAGEWFVKVGIGSTAFIDDLRISIASIQFESDPARYRVTAYLIAAGVKEMKIENVDIGYTVRYPSSKNIYDIQLVKIDAFSASFVIKPSNP